jgi:D-glycero-D-manno-heptose 1,7-bisphosphate phosphatase
MRWCALWPMPSPNKTERRRAAFLDRDGTIIHDRHYLSDPAGVELLPGAGAALRALSQDGYLLIVISNQSGMARGMFGEAERAAVQARVSELLAAEGVRLDGDYFCPHHPDFGSACECRKPGLLLYRQAALEHGIDLAQSVYIGDRPSDVQPAAVLGGQGILVRTGYGASHEADFSPGGGPAGKVVVVDDLAAAAEWLRRRNREGILG